MKGGFQVESRLATSLDEIAMEAMAARESTSRRERDLALDEIQRLARACAELHERALTPAQRS